MGDHEILLVALIGAFAGLCGSLAGIGGSMLMLPLLALVFTAEDFHLFAAAGLCVNVLIASPAVWRHWRVGVLDFGVLLRTLPPLAICIAVGVIFGNGFEGETLAQSLGVILAVLVVVQLVVPFRDHVEAMPQPSGDAPPAAESERGRTIGLAGVGAATGLVAGFMGIGGGLMLVVGTRIFGRLTIRKAIASSSALILVSSSVGATLKLSTLHVHGFAVKHAVALACVMGAWAVLGSMVGARLVHVIPTKPLHWLVSALLASNAIYLIIR
ncbi:MAG: sulfite exporter TauE/SafE family protein [Planctomycetota bacterium]